MREIFAPVIAMTITLAAVYAPIGFAQGLTGALFREFAVTLAGAVVISGFIARDAFADAGGARAEAARARAAEPLPADRRPQLRPRQRGLRPARRLDAATIAG